MECSCVCGPKETISSDCGSQTKVSIPQELMKMVPLYQRLHFHHHWQKGQMALVVTVSMPRVCWSPGCHSVTSFRAHAGFLALLTPHP